MGLGLGSGLGLGLGLGSGLGVDIDGEDAPGATEPCRLDDGEAYRAASEDGHARAALHLTGLELELGVGVGVGVGLG